MKKFWIIVFALSITVVAAVYQRITGPTYAKRVKIEINGVKYKLKFPRSQAGSDSAEVVLPFKDESLQAVLMFKRYKTDDKYTAVPFVRKGGNLVAKLPGQPPAGKLEYFVEVDTPKGERIIIPGEKSIVIRFKGEVPSYILVLHVFFMFFAMFFANYAGLLAILNREGYYKAAVITFVLITIGGMILGPIVQKYAFGEYWAGVPFGWDLTDNKMLIAFIFWLIPIFVKKDKIKKTAVILATLVTLIVFSIPHSMHGSELNYETGTIQQG